MYIKAVLLIFVAVMVIVPIGALLWSNAWKQLKKKK